MADDEYARKYMSAEGALALSRMRMGPLLFVILALSALALTGATLATRQWGLLAMLPFYGLLALLFSHVRATVTPAHLHVQYGLFGPKVPIERVRNARAARYDWKRYGGWGLRFGRNGERAYSVTGGKGVGLECEVLRDDGSTYTMFVSSDEPEALVQAIAQAQAQAGLPATAQTGVRVDAAGADAADPRASRASMEDYKIIQMSRAADRRRIGE